MYTRTLIVLHDNRLHHYQFPKSLILSTLVKHAVTNTTYEEDTRPQISSVGY